LTECQRSLSCTSINCDRDQAQGHILSGFINLYKKNTQSSYIQNFFYDEHDVD